MTVLQAFLFVAAMAALPVYLGASGGIQIAHVLLLACLATVPKAFKLTRIELAMLALAGFVTARETPVAAEWSDLLPAAYIIFNIFIVSLFRQSFPQPHLRSAIAFGTFAAVGISISGVFALGYSFVAGEGIARSIGTFNNPNQLGYFAVCVSCIGSVLYQWGSLSKRTYIPLLLGASFLAVASLSKAAMIATIFSLCVILFIQFASASWKRLLIGIVAAASTVAVGAFQLLSGKYDDLAFVWRLRSIGTQHDDSFEERGYGILFDGSLFEFLAGFGAEKTAHIVGHEIHSTVYSFFGTYGVVGGLLFSYILFIWIAKLVRDFGAVGFLTIAVPPMLYGLTHNGSRFAIFWALVGMSMATLPRAAHDNRKPFRMFQRRRPSVFPLPRTRAGGLETACK